MFRDFLDGDSLISSTFVSERDNRVNEFSEIITNRKINKNILEKTNKVFTGETTDTLKALEFT